MNKERPPVLLGDILIENTRFSFLFQRFQEDYHQTFQQEVKPIEIKETELEFFRTVVRFLLRRVVFIE